MKRPLKSGRFHCPTFHFSLFTSHFSLLTSHLLILAPSKPLFPIMKKLHYLFFALLATTFMACNDKTGADNSTKDADAKGNPEAQAFIDGYAKKYQELYYASSLAQWESNIHIVEGDSTNAVRTKAANEAFAEFTGSEENINKTREFLQKTDLSPLQKRQLDGILYSAADNPAIVKDIVKSRIKAETEQTEKLFGFNFMLNGNKVSTNNIDSILRVETNLTQRRKAWESSKEVGKGLKPGLVNLRNLRNETVQALGYDDFFSYQVSDYGMTRKEMMDLMQGLVRDIWPLYRELHTYARYTLAKKYNVAEVPDLLPADWLPNRWGQDWSALVDVEGLNLDDALKSKTPEWMVKTAEEFYVSLGFEQLPAVFWEKSSLYPAPKDADYKKNNHASAWHLDLERDVRSLMSIEPNSEWYETTHHELGHIYYYLSYTNPDVPLLLRKGANRGFHEAIGSLLGLAAMQKPYMQHLGLIPADSKSDDQKTLLKEALNYIVFMPFGAGVMTEFEHDLYAGKLPESEFNKRWWELAAKYQGMAPPTTRGEEYCDAASKTHINDDAAQYYDYAMSYVLLFQFHDHIAKNILKQDPHATNYHGNKEVGNFLKGLLTPGGSRDWRELLKEKLGAEMSAKAMLDYFNPLMDFLKKENAGRKYTLPETL
jgi:peptidyl-dipeptidase A